jgi:hypothetical protein
MISKKNRKLIVLTVATYILSVAVSAATPQSNRSFDNNWGNRYKSAAPISLAALHPALAGSTPVDLVRRWNSIAVDSSGLDHTPVATGENRIFGHQLGPGRSARAMAIVHISMFEAINAIDGGHKSLTGLARASSGVSMSAAIVQAAHDALVEMFPSHKPNLDQMLADDLDQITDLGKAGGITLGKRAAKSTMLPRATDGSQHAEPRVNIDYIPSDAPGIWRQDPISLLPVALGAHWNEVRPFVLRSASQFRLPPPPPMDSPEYAAAFDEVKRLGGDGITTPTERTADQTEAGIYWAYDGTPSLCAPPRLYNQIARLIADIRGTNDVVQLARLLALVHVAMADAGIASWESKFFYAFWRPVTAIREADEGTGPTGDGDGNPDTIGDPTFSPLGAPASNLNGPNFTPPFPSYPSGHATFGGTLFQVLRRFYGTDNIPFTFVSDEFNGTTLGNDGNVRPLLPRTFTTLSQAEEENGQSRIYLGIHWSFDKTEGIAQGRRVADFVFKTAYQPVKK